MPDQIGQRRWGVFVVSARIQSRGWVLAAIAAASLLQGGCFYSASVGCFHSPAPGLRTNDDPAHPIEFELGSVRFWGTLTTSNTIAVTFLPVVPVFVVSTNPYNFNLGSTAPIDGPLSEFVRVTHVSLTTPEGHPLLVAEGPDGLLDSSIEVGDLRTGGKPVFPSNPEAGDLRRRTSDRKGWPYSRSVQVPSGCRELVLHLRLQTRGPGGEFGPEQSTEVRLTRQTHSGLFLLTDSIYLATGTF